MYWIFPLGFKTDGHKNHKSSHRQCWIFPLGFETDGNLEEKIQRVAY